jgi:phosphoenolpyruvate-protein kinase (PTS system EI component)
MEASAIPEIKEALHRVALSEAAAVARDAILQETAEDVERTVAAAFAPRLFDLLADSMAETEAGGTA